jgi:hypothetical protein
MMVRSGVLKTSRGVVRTDLVRVQVIGDQQSLYASRL